MHRKLFFIRKTKALFEKYRLDILFESLSNVFLNLIYLSKLSRWIANTQSPPFNDFYNKKVVYEERIKLHEYIFNTQKLNSNIDYIEFGVAQGTAFKWWVEWNKNPNSRFFGFDTFTGLPEDFGVMKKHDYNTLGIFPDIQDSRVKFIPGLFQDSFPEFLINYSSKQRKVIHLDADLYSSTLFVLTNIYPYLKKDDILIFDEFGVPTHEFRAYTDFTSSYYVDFEILGAINNYLQVAFRII